MIKSIVLVLGMFVLVGCGKDHPLTTAELCNIDYFDLDIKMHNVKAGDSLATVTAKTGYPIFNSGSLYYVSARLPAGALCSQGLFHFSNGVVADVEVGANGHAAIDCTNYTDSSPTDPTGPGAGTKCNSSF